MASYCDYNVYVRKRGESKKVLFAKFLHKVDAYNYAYAESVGRSKREDLTVLVLLGGRKVVAYRMGRSV